jgi:predicted RecB family nuclease
MVMHDLPVGETPEAISARGWLLRYNQGDVEATLAVREWMAAASVQSVENL